MPTTKSIAVSRLSLDLRNYRTIPQTSESNAIHAMVAIGGARFWALCESLMVSGFLPTENIIVFKKRNILTVKEGNRRIAAMKIILGLTPTTGLVVPAGIRTKLAAVTSRWKAAHVDVPCVVYGPSEEAGVNQVVSLAHGKGQDAARANWEAIARARHQRDAEPSSEPALDLLEKYLAHGANITAKERELWAGIYPITVLEEAFRKFHKRFGVTSQRHGVEIYPGPPIEREILEQFLHDIGSKTIGFWHIRQQNPDILASAYNLPGPTAAAAPVAAAPASTGSHGTSAASGTGPGAGTQAVPGSAAGGAPQGGTSASAPPPPRGRRAISMNDPRAVTRRLRRFAPRGNDRDKVETLRLEIIKLNVTRHPHAFCFVLRSMFELSAKAYCHDHRASGLTTKLPNNNDKSLAKILGEVSAHLTGGNPQSPMGRQLHGAMAELGSHDGILSVTSMNQLVHNPHFTISESHICAVFNNIFPLLEAMNS